MKEFGILKLGHGVSDGPLNRSFIVLQKTTTASFSRVHNCALGVDGLNEELRDKPAVRASSLLLLRTRTRMVSLMCLKVIECCYLA